MRVVVTGSSGRVGRVTVLALIDAGHDVVMLDRTPPASDAVTGATFVSAGADDYKALRRTSVGADAIVHLAGLPKPDGYTPQEVHNNNVTASYNVLCVAVELGIPRVIMASSVNAIGLTWSRDPTFDYFPVDEQHVTRNEDAYSLSKWAGEQQADSVVRLHPELSIVSLRLHMFMADRAEAASVSTGDLGDAARRGLWGYTTHRMWVDACVRALTADITGHEVFFIVADRTIAEPESADLAQRYFPTVELRAALEGNAGFFDCTRAKTLLGWSGTD